MRIFVDVDDVCADLMPNWLGRYNTEFNDSLTPSDMLSWDYHSHVKPECAEQIYKYLTLPDMYDSVLPIAGAIEGVNHLRADGHRIIFATSTYYHQAGKKFQWLKDHGFLPNHGFKSADYIEIQDKSLLRGDVMVDDGLHNLKEFQGHKIVFHCPHNQTCADYSRAYNWEGVVSLVRKIEEIWL